MPCYQRQLMSIDWSQADETILRATLEALGLKSREGETIRGIHSGRQLTIPEMTFAGYLNGTYSAVRYHDGKLDISSGAPEAAELAIRRGYGEATVRAAAKRFGWNVQQDAKNQQQFTVRRRA